MSDRVGRKPVLLAAQAGTFVSLVLVGSAWALPVLFVARTLDGITGANLSTVQSAISDMTDEDGRARGLDWVGAASGLGFIFGPLVSGLALRWAGNNYAAPAFVAAAFALTGGLLTLFLFRETAPAAGSGRAHARVLVTESLWAGLRSSRLGPLFLLVFAVQLIFSVFTSTFALFTLERLGFNSVDNAIFFGIFGLLLVAMQGFFVGRWIPRFGEHRVLTASFLLSACGFGLAALTPRQAVPWYSESAMVAELTQQGASLSQLELLPGEVGAGVGAFVFMLIALLPGPLGFTLQMPTLQTLITRRVPSTEMGQALGISASFAGAGMVVGPILGGLLFDHLGPSAPFTVSAALSMVLLGAFWARESRAS